MDINPAFSAYLLQMVGGYVLSVAVETAVLLVGLSNRHPTRDRLFAGAWLTACTYPVVWLVLPPLFPDYRLPYLLVAETFAPLGECVLFWLAFIRPLPAARAATARDLLAIVAANLGSFATGELIRALVL